MRWLLVVSVAASARRQQVGVIALDGDIRVSSPEKGARYARCGLGLECGNFPAAAALLQLSGLQHHQGVPQPHRGS